MMFISCFSDEISSSLKEQLDTLEELKLTRLEIRTVDDINIMDFSSAKLKEIKRQCDQRGFTVTAVSSPIGKESLNATRADLVNKAQRACEIASILNCSFIRVFSFYKDERPHSEALDRSCENLKIMADVASEFSDTLIMEGGSNTVGQMPEDARILLQRVDSPNFRYAYDPGALVAAGKRPYDQGFSILEPYISYMHIKDACFNQSTRCLAGHGDGQVQEALISLSRIPGFIVSLEPHLSYAGAKRGFSGKENFILAHKALTDILEKNNIDYI